MLHLMLSQDDDEAELNARGTELLADNDDNLNAVEDSESSQYGVIESGDEAEKDDVETGEYISDEDGENLCAPEDTVDDPDSIARIIAIGRSSAETRSYLGRHGAMSSTRWRQ
ncbi:hypothetical protein PI124_g23284 [Phytophthora idaei]|nr:hypothetical protein PI124_g23284 [Phytophthora idaei]